MHVSHFAGQKVRGLEMIFWQEVNQIIDKRNGGE